MMETSTLALPSIGMRPNGQSRFSKALPAPPPGMLGGRDNIVQRPARKESLQTPINISNLTIGIPETVASRPRTAGVERTGQTPTSTTPSSAATTRTATYTLPLVPSQSAPMSAPMPIKRRPVGGASTATPAPPVQDDNVYVQSSPTESIGSLLSEYSKDRSDVFDDKRSSSETTDTKGSSVGTSTPQKAVEASARVPLTTNVPSTAAPIAAPSSVSVPVYQPQLIQEQVYIPPVSSNLWRKKSREQVAPNLTKHEQHELPPLPPQPPFKDASTPKTPTHAALAVSVPPSNISQPPLAHNGGTGFGTTSNLLRRRSIKADKSLPVAELNLTKSNGHTTSPVSMPLTKQKSTAQLRTDSRVAQPLPILPSAPMLGLPGRNVKPLTPSPPAIPVEAPAQLNPRTKSLVRRQAEQYEQALRERDSKDRLVSPTAATFQSPTHDARRPPTPEYTRGDVERSLTNDLMFTHAAPASPTLESAPEVAPPPPAKTQPLVMAAGTQAAVNVLPPRQPGASLAGTSASAAPQIKNVKSLSHLRMAAPSPPPELSLPPPPKSAGLTHLKPRGAGLPRSPAPMRSMDNLRKAVSPQELPMRRSSRQLPPTPPSAVSTSSPPLAAPVARKAISPIMTGTTASTSPVVPRQAQPQMTTTSPLASHREEERFEPSAILQVVEPEELAVPNRGDLNYFPSIRMVYATGSVLPAPPLRGSHYNCFQNHVTMLPNKNEFHPLACQTCTKADKELRWTCSFCCLRVCKQCMKGLGQRQRHLGRLVDDLKIGGGKLAEQEQEEMEEDQRRRAAEMEKPRAPLGDEASRPGSVPPQESATMATGGLQTGGGDLHVGKTRGLAIRT